MEVHELMSFLASVSPNAKVGTLGHFGEFYEMDLPEVIQTHTRSPDHRGRANKSAEFNAVVFTCPDVGPEPN